MSRKSYHKVLLKDCFFCRIGWLCRLCQVVAGRVEIALITSPERGDGAVGERCGMSQLNTYCFANSQE